MRLLEDDHPIVRLSAVRALGQIGDPTACASLIKRLEDKDARIRRETLIALARLGATEALPEMTMRLADRFHEVRLCAAESIVRLGSRDGADALLSAAKRHPAVSSNPLNALRQPENWNRLRTTRLRSWLSGRGAGELQTWASESGLPLRGFDPEWDWSGRPGEHTLLEALEIALDGSGAAFVIEEDHIRIVDTKEALDFWGEWAALRRISRP